MKRSSFNSKSLNNLSPARLETYLEAEGWRKTGEIPAKYSVWHYADKEVIVPKKQDFADYSNRIFDVLSALATIENIGVEEIYNNITLSICDILKIRVNASNQKHTIAFDHGLEILDSTRRMIQASARAVLGKKPNYVGKVEDEAAQYMREVELGQTESGSFIITVLSPIHNIYQMNLNQLNLSYGIPYERKVLETLEKALTQMTVSAEDYLQNQNINCFANAINYGVSKNLCEAISSIANCSPRDDIEININWSPLIDKKPPSILNIRQRILPAITKAIDYYDSIQRHENVSIEGYVKNLNRESIQQDTGQIIINAFYDGGYKRVRVEVNPENHKIAIQAYEAKQKVSCSGTLYKKGRFWHLGTPSNLELV